MRRTKFGTCRRMKRKAWARPCAGPQPLSCFTWPTPPCPAQTLPAQPTRCSPATCPSPPPSLLRLLFPQTSHPHHWQRAVAPTRRSGLHFCGTPLHPQPCRARHLPQTIVPSPPRLQPLLPLHLLWSRLAWKTSQQPPYSGRRCWRGAGGTPPLSSSRTWPAWGSWGWPPAAGQEPQKAVSVHPPLTASHAQGLPRLSVLQEAVDLESGRMTPGLLLPWCQSQVWGLRSQSPLSRSVGRPLPSQSAGRQNPQLQLCPSQTPASFTHRCMRRPVLLHSLEVSRSLGCPTLVADNSWRWRSPVRLLGATRDQWGLWFQLQQQTNLKQEKVGGHGRGLVLCIDKSFFSWY